MAVMTLRRQKAVGALPVCGSSDEDVHDSREGEKYVFMFVVRGQLDEEWR